MAGRTITGPVVSLMVNVDDLVWVLPQSSPHVHVTVVVCWHADGPWNGVAVQETVRGPVAHEHVAESTKC